MTRPLRALIVEHDDNDVQLILRELRRVDFEPVFEVVAGEAALRAALTGRTWDIVLSDYNLPGLDAPHALAMVRERHPELPFVVVSGSVGEELAVAIMAAGAQDFVFKDQPARLGPVVERELREATVRRERELAQEQLRTSYENLRQAMRDTVRAMAATVETRDPYTAGHQRRVAELSTAIATRMRLPAHDIEGIFLAATVHDIGKIAVPAEILVKPTKLSNVEFSLIKGHSQAGYDILKGIAFPWPIADMTLQHHERMDGSGYPQGLKGDACLLGSRIIATADVVEAMSSHRPYRAALGIDVALGEIRKNRERRYDPDTVDACVAAVTEDKRELK
jgi:putative two-component system response regulator